MTTMMRNQSPATNENDVRMRSNRPSKDNKENKETKDQPVQQQTPQNESPEEAVSPTSSPTHTRERRFSTTCCFCWCCTPPCFSNTRTITNNTHNPTNNNTTTIREPLYKVLDSLEKAVKSPSYHSLRKLSLVSNKGRLAWVPVIEFGSILISLATTGFRKQGFVSKKESLGSGRSSKGDNSPNSNMVVKNDQLSQSRSKELDSNSDREELLSLEDMKNWSESFDRLIRSNGGRRKFREFLRMEYSEENMLFWLACEELKREQNSELIEEKARLIYEDYISILSPKETTDSDMIKIPEEVILPADVRLRVVVEGRPPRCYLCSEKGHMKARCPQREEMEQPKEQEKVNDEVQEEEKEGQKKKKETKETEKAVIKEVEKEIEREIEKEVEKEVMEEEKIEASRLESCLTHEVEQQQEEEVTTTEMDKVMPRAEHSKRKRRKYNWYFVTYDKNVCTEKMISKMKLVIRVKLPKDSYGENVKVILIVKERYSRWKGKCRFEPPTYEVSLDSRVREVINQNMLDPSPHTFDEAQLQIYTLMHQDPYPRFLNSQLYKKLIEEASS
uniref:CCHC-type domain-containing protein n=1 Tax=Octopus bimaculoides TaxID=37653 RepID=A0A0L8FRC8_OCTBM